MMQLKYNKLYLITILLIINIVACGVNPFKRSTVQRESTQRNTVDAVDLKNEVATPFVAGSPEPQVPTIATPSVSISSTIVISSSGTTISSVSMADPLNSEQTAQILMEMFSKPDCRLPCFMGFYPAKTTLVEISDPLNPLASRTRFSERPQYSSFTADFLDSSLVAHDLFYTLRYLFREGDNILWEIDAELPQGELFSIKRIFDEYGIATDAWISAIDFSGITHRDPLFTVFFYYPDNGFFVHYEIDPQKNLTDSGVIGCLDRVTSSHMMIWEPTKWDPDQMMNDVNQRIIDNRKSTFASMRFLDEPDSWSGKYYEQPLSDTTNFTTQSLYNAVINSDDAICIETLFEHWPPYSGE